MLPDRANDLKSFTAEADKFFNTYVENGSVAYTRIKLPINEAESLYNQIGMASLAGIDDNSKKVIGGW